MDWKEKGIEAGYLGLLATIGAWLLKKFKPITKWFTGLYKLSERVDKIDIKLASLETRIAVDENMIRSMLDNSKVAAFMLDKDFELSYVNTVWLERLGFSNDEDALGFGFLKAIPDSYMKQIERQMKNSKDHPGKFSDKILFKNIKTESEFWMYCMSTPIYDYEDNIHATLGFLYEIE